MSRQVIFKVFAIVMLSTVALFFSGCGDSRTRGTGVGTGPGGTGTTGGTGGGGGSETTPPRFIYFATGAHPSTVAIDQNGKPGPVQDFANPDVGRSNSTVAANPAGTFLYVTEYENTGSGLYFVAEFSIDHSTGAITHNATVPVANAGLGIKVDPTGSVLALAGASVSVPDNANPSLALYKIAADGSLTAGAAPVPLFGMQVQDLIFDASGKNLYVLSNQAQPATPGSSLQAFRVDATTGTATLVQSIQLSIDTVEIAVVGSSYVYVSGAGGPDNNVAGYSIQADGSLAPITGTPFGSGVSTYGMAASPNGSMVYASDIFQNDIAWYSLDSTGVLKLAGSTAANTIVPATGGFTMIDRSGKYLYTRACDPQGPPPGCSEVLWGGTIGSDGSVTPMSGTPFPVQLFQFDIVY